MRLTAPTESEIALSPAISIAQAVFLGALAAFGYNQALEKGAQSASAQIGILIGWVAVPAFLLCACFALLHWYPLAGSTWEKIKGSLAASHRDKEKRYLEAHGYTFTD